MTQTLTDKYAPPINLLVSPGAPPLLLVVHPLSVIVGLTSVIVRQPPLEGGREQAHAGTPFSLPRLPLGEAYTLNSKKDTTQEDKGGADRLKLKFISLLQGSGKVHVDKQVLYYPLLL